MVLPAFEINEMSLQHANKMLVSMQPACMIHIKKSNILIRVMHAGYKATIYLNYEEVNDK